MAWCRQLALVVAVFALLGFLTSAVVFANAPNWWWGNVRVAIAAALAGVTAWVICCGQSQHPRWWRVLVAGLLAGLLVHPYFWLLAVATDALTRAALPLLPSDIVRGTMFSLLVVGIITVPAGVVAAVCCWALNPWERH